MRLTVFTGDTGIIELETGHFASSYADNQVTKLADAEKRPARALFVPDKFPYTYTHIDELQGWPQRLLHVPTMTSFEWQPGNIYNGQREPKYRAISYTWGRYRLKEKGEDGRKEMERSEVQPLLIKNVPWDIPRIKPEIFTTQMMEKLLAEVRKPLSVISKEERTRLNIGHLLFDFVWLDIACIDQRWGPLAALEIGRQFSIFERNTGFKAGTIWLSQTGKDKMTRERLQESVAIVLNSDRGDENILLHDDQHIECVRTFLGLFEDPWFSSLWTLQEAFICRDAVFHFANGDRFTYFDDYRNTHVPIHLDKLLLGLSDLYKAIMHHKKKGRVLSQRDEKDLSLFNEAHARRGLSILRFTRPLAILTAASTRQATEPEDRVYGIMQIFGYKLGTARDPHGSFDQGQLLDELGEQLMRDQPWDSQTHSFPKPAEFGKAWRIGLNTVIPASYRFGRDGSVWERGFAPSKLPSLVKLSTVVVNNSRFGYIKGKARTLKSLLPAWQASRYSILVVPDASHVYEAGSAGATESAEHHEKYIDELFFVEGRAKELLCKAALLV